MISRRLILSLLVLLSGSALAQSRYWVTAAEWASPRSGEALVQFEDLSAAVREWSRTPDARLLIRHPGGEAGTLWAHELRGWLVSLGIASARIELLAGSERDDAVGIEVQHGGTQP